MGGGESVTNCLTDSWDLSSSGFFFISVLSLKTNGTLPMSHLQEENENYWKKTTPTPPLPAPPPPPPPLHGQDGHSSDNTHRVVTIQGRYFGHNLWFNWLECNAMSKLNRNFLEETDDL